MKSANAIFCGAENGALLKASELLCLAADHAGYDAVMHIERGQEDGRVSCHIRWGEKIWSPLIPAGQADMLLSLDLRETLLLLPMLRPGGTIIIDGNALAGSDIGLTGMFASAVDRLGCAVHKVPAAFCAEDPALAPASLAGVAASFLPWPDDVWRRTFDALGDHAPASVRDAFHKGKSYEAETLRFDISPRFSPPLGPTDKGIRTFDEMLERVRSLPPRRVCIAGAENRAALHAGIECVERGLGTPVFVGNRETILSAAREAFVDFPIGDYEIISTASEQETAEQAVAVVREGRADILLKGGVNTPTLMRAVLHATKGLRSGSLLSDSFVFEFPDEDGTRLVMITDGGVTLQPTIQQKIQILRNAVVVAHALGNAMPRVALLAASETINPALAATMDAAAITSMNRSGQITGCIVEGPMALDVAVSRKAAAIKGTDSPVAGQADILVAASIDTANALAKSTTYFAGYRLSHVIVGGTAPILIASRSDTADAKLLSIALGSLMARHFEEQRAQAG
ncbi:MAG: phosphate acyltransferase [Bacteroidota bacterium]|nr:phosphate acyltransferase [Bacteroidota bacterium]